MPDPDVPSVPVLEAVLAEILQPAAFRNWLLQQEDQDSPHTWFHIYEHYINKEIEITQEGPARLVLISVYEVTIRTVYISVDRTDTPYHTTLLHAPDWLQEHYRLLTFINELERGNDQPYSHYSYRQTCAMLDAIMQRQAEWHVPLRDKEGVIEIGR